MGFLLRAGVRSQRARRRMAIPGLLRRARRALAAASQQISQTCFPSVLHFLCSRSEWISCSSEARRFLCRDGYPKGCPGGEIFQRSETQRVAAPVPREQGGGTLQGAGVLVLLFGFACEKIWRLPNIPQILSFMPAFDGLGNCGSFHSYVNVYQRVNPSEV